MGGVVGFHKVPDTHSVLLVGRRGGSNRYRGEYKGLTLILYQNGFNGLSCLAMIWTVIHATRIYSVLLYARQGSYASF